MSEDDVEIIWMRSVLWIRHPSALKYYCPPPPVSRPSNLYVQKDAAMPLHPLGPAILFTPPQSQRARTMMDTPTVAGRGHNPHFAPSTSRRRVAHRQLIPASLPNKEKNCSGELSTNISLQHCSWWNLWLPQRSSPSAFVWFWRVIFQFKAKPEVWISFQLESNCQR